MSFTFPENWKVVMLGSPAAADSFTYDIISCKNAHKVWFVIQHYSGGGDSDLTLSLIEAKEVAGTNTTAVTATFPIWSDTNAGTASDTLVRQTDAASYKIDTGAGTDYVVVIEWDPAQHTSGYDCIQLADSGGHASNIMAAMAVIEPRYKADQPPTVITD